MKSLLAVLFVVGLAVGPAYAVCSYPKAPDKIPDGNTATLQEMVAAKGAVDSYNKDIEAYTSCLKLEYDDRLAKDGSTMTDAQKKDLEKRQTQKNNAAVEELEQVAKRMNEQIRIYKAKAASNKS